jgi:hypothetical protein
MAVEIGKVTKGMSVLTADGVELGLVADVWIGTDPAVETGRCDEDVCSRLEVHRGGFPRRTVLYIPMGAIEHVLVASVLLNVDEATATRMGWTHRPTWLGSD